MCLFRKKQNGAEPIEEHFTVYGDIENTTAVMHMANVICPDREHMSQPLDVNRIMEDRATYCVDANKTFYIYDAKVVDTEYDSKTKIFSLIIENYHEPSIHKICIDGDVSDCIYPNLRFWIVRFEGEKYAFQFYSQDWFHIFDDAIPHLRELDTLCFNEWYRTKPTVLRHIANKTKRQS